MVSLKKRLDLLLMHVTLYRNSNPKSLSSALLQLTKTHWYRAQSSLR